jgi:DNA-binding response OmpR family regulator
MPSILIVEDDLMIADMTEEFLVTSGYSVCGIARTVDAAIALAKAQSPDLALIDLRLAEGGLGTDVAAELRKNGQTAILFVSGNISQVELTSEDGDGSLVKPYLAKDLLCSLSIISEVVATGSSAVPHPRGFKLLKPGTQIRKAMHA